MSEASSNFQEQPLPGFAAPTSLPALVVGTTLSSSQGGLLIEESGQALAPASRTAWPGNRNEMLMSVTSGLIFSGSSASAALQRSLANRLITSMGRNGSRAYGLTWKARAMPSGMPLLTLRASERTRSDKDCIGWQTPRARGDAGGQRWRSGEARNLEDQARIFSLSRGLTIEEVSRLSLSPRFVRRLMGYPAEWECSAVSGMRLTPKSRRSL